MQYNLQLEDKMSTQNTPMQMATSLPANADCKQLPIQIEGEHIWKWAQMLGGCPFYQKLGAGGVAAIILTARELKLPPMACLNGLLYNVDGKITMSGQLINTMICNSGHEAKVMHLDKQKCVIRFKRSNQNLDEAQFYTFSMDDAKEAKLAHKDNWVKYPRDMLFNRCISAGARKFMPEVVGPYYTHEELREDYTPVAAEMNMKEVKTLPVSECEDVTELCHNESDTNMCQEQSKDIITTEQVTILSSLYSQIDEKCKTNVDNNMKSVRASTFNDLLKIYYETFLRDMSNNIEMNKNKAQVA